jgi:hypothetical protein
LLFFRRSGVFETGERIVEAIVLTQKIGDRILVLQQQGHGNEVRLHGQGMRNLTRRVDSLMGLV